MCHGFGDHSNDMLLDLAVKFVGDGYAVLMMDAEGHGLSDGLHGCVHDIHDVAFDLSEYFVSQIHTSRALRDKPFFLYGISMVRSQRDLFAILVLSIIITCNVAGRCSCFQY